MIEILSSLLFYPFQKEQISWLRPEEKTLFWNMVHVSEIHEFKEYQPFQTFKPYAQTWLDQGIKGCITLPENNLYKNIFCTLPKQKESALYTIASALNILDSKGLLMLVAANDSGGKKIESWVKEFGLIPTSLSKSKCRIVWAYKENLIQDKIDFYIKRGGQQKIKIEGQNFITQPGIFGWNKIDKGSKLLIENISDELVGTGADFGAGYGYLSHEILKKYNNIEKLHVLEADYRALMCAEENLSAYGDKVEYDWVDLTQKQAHIKNLDWIIMNPPFHEGKETRSHIGLQFIEQAQVCLKKTGELYMVANIHLPYEKHLKGLFSKVDKIYEGDGFKIFRGQS